jgi:SH3-like domain-containing protein
MPRPCLALLAVLALHLTAPPGSAQAPDETAEGPASVRTDTPSGLPVPRFVSFKSDRTNCRLGPSFEHPVVAVYLRAGAPVEVVAETTDHWRKVRDQDGLGCWAHQSTLRAVSHVLVLEEVAIRAQPEEASPARARLAEGVLARLIRSRQGWSLISAGGVKGWAPTGHLWGAGAPCPRPADCN